MFLLANHHFSDDRPTPVYLNTVQPMHDDQYISNPHSTPHSTPPTANRTTAGPSAILPTSNVTSTNTNRFYICPTFVYRLGNNLFQFASALGIAYSKNMTLIVSENDAVFKYFNLHNTTHLLIRKRRDVCSKAKVHVEKQASAYDGGLLDTITRNATVHVGYYLQSWKYFQHASNELRVQLEFRKYLQNKAKSTIQDILDKYGKSRMDVTLIAIHVRRTDMYKNQRGYLVASKEYFSKAMDLFKNFTFPIFILCSDDLKWSKSNTPSTHRINFISGNLPIQDMALMASCDHVISSVGSFSWWTGWLSNGTVIYFKWPAKEGTAIRRAYSSDYMDYFHPSWIGLN